MASYENKNPYSTAAGERAETAVSELREKYAKKVKEEYDLAAEKLRRERDDALRESWVAQQRARAALPEQLAAAGINGGASETVLSELSAGYQGERNDIRREHEKNIGELGAREAEKQTEAEKDFNEKWIQYLLSIAKEEEKERIEKGYFYR